MRQMIHKIWRNRIANLRAEPSPDPALSTSWHRCHCVASCQMLEYLAVDFRDIIRINFGLNEGESVSLEMGRQGK